MFLRILLQVNRPRQVALVELAELLGLPNLPPRVLDAIRDEHFDHAAELLRHAIPMTERTRRLARQIASGEWESAPGG